MPQPLFPGYPADDLRYLLQNLTVIGITDGCSRQCSHCGMNPPRSVSAMDFDLFAGLSQYRLKVVPYYRSEPTDYFDPRREKDLSDIVEQAFAHDVRLHITSAWWSSSDQRAQAAMRRLNLGHLDFLRMSVHLFWPTSVLAARKLDILKGCELLSERHAQKLAMNVCYSQANAGETRAFAQDLSRRFPEIFDPERITFYQVFREGRAAGRMEGDAVKRVFLNRLLVMPDGEVCVGYRQGAHYRLFRSGLHVVDPYDASSFESKRQLIAQRLGRLPDAIPSLDQYLSYAATHHVHLSPLLLDVLQCNSSTAERLARLNERVEETDCYFDPLYRCFCDVFSFDEAVVEEFAHEVLVTKHASPEVYRRAFEYFCRTNRLPSASADLKRILEDDPLRFRTLIDLLGFLDGDDAFLSGLAKTLRGFAPSRERSDALDSVQRALARKKFLREQPR